MTEQIITFRKVVKKSLLREIPNEQRAALHEGDFIEVTITTISPAKEQIQ